MWEPNRSTVRPPAVAGRFYPADPDQCRQQARSFLHADPSASAHATPWIGGVVPHAGWICSGALAGRTVATLADSFTRAPNPPDLVIVFGAIHTPLRIQSAALDSHSTWALPGGDAELAQDLERRLEQRGNLFVTDDRLHDREHAVEVNLPLIRLAFPAAKVVPIEVPVIDEAELIGRKTAQTVREAGLTAVYLASSDFTHYGPQYGFAPLGIGEQAMQWAKENDRRLLDRIERLDVAGVIPEVRQRHNACGAGALTSMLAACREAGARDARVLAHANSYETLASVEPQPPTHAVGYASVVVG